MGGVIFSPSVLGIIFAVYLLVAVVAAYLLLGKEPPRGKPVPGPGEAEAAPEAASADHDPVVETVLADHPGESAAPAVVRDLAVHGMVSLSTGGGLDFRRIDAASVELRADQMLAPLRYVSEVLSDLKGVGRDNELSVNNDGAAEVAEAKLRRLISQIEDIDLMLQVSDGHINVQVTRFQIKELVHEIALKAALAAEKTGGSVRWVDREEQGKPYLVDLDRQLLQRIISQLVNSAFRATREGSVEVVFNSEPFRKPAGQIDLFAGGAGDFRRKVMVEVRFRRPESKDDTLQMVVAGLAQNRVEELVERRMIDPSPDSDLFGLSLVRELVNRLGADLSYENFEGGRAAFILTLELETIPVS